MNHIWGRTANLSGFKKKIGETRALGYSIREDTASIWDHWFFGSFSKTWPSHPQSHRSLLRSTRFFCPSGVFQTNLFYGFPTENTQLPLYYLWKLYGLCALCNLGRPPPDFQKACAHFSCRVYSLRSQRRWYRRQDSGTNLCDGWSHQRFFEQLPRSHSQSMPHLFLHSWYLYSSPPRSWGSTIRRTLN